MGIHHLSHSIRQLLYICGAVQFKQEWNIVYSTVRILTAFCKNTLLRTGKRINLTLLIGPDLRCKHDIVFQFFNGVVFMNITCFYCNAKLIRNQNAKLHGTDRR